MTTSTHVAIFLSSLRGGGAERAMTNLANEFVARGLRVDLLLARAEGPYLSLVDPEVRVIGFNARRPLLALPAMVRYLKTQRPAAMVSALDHTNLVAVAARYLSRVRLRHIVSHQNDASIRPRLLTETKELPNYWLLGPGYRRADGVIAVSHGVADSLINHHGVPRHLVHVIHNPVVVTAPSDEEQPPHNWMEPGEPPIVLGVGEFIRQKGFDTLLQAFALINQKRSARLVILGEGRQRPELEQLVTSLGVRDQVLLPGFVSDPWVWMRNAAVFTLSSRWEGLPGVLLEAMACGTPVVSTDCPSGPAEILEDGKWGQLVPVDDPEALAGAIIATLDQDTPPPVAERSADFDLQTSADNYLEILGISV